MRSGPCTACAVAVAATLLAACAASPPPEAAPTAATAGPRITVLYDAFGEPSDLEKDWGFAALIEYRGKRILFDTGNNADILARNVRAKGVDLTKLDFVIVSHRHGDHMGGLNYVVRVNPRVKIYTPKENFGVFGAALPGTFYRRDPALPDSMRYFGGAPPDTLRFGTPWPEADFVWVTETTEVAPGFHLLLLRGPWGVDLDVMEMSLAIETPEGTVVVVGCAHPTIEKIVQTASERIAAPIHLVIGGLHLLPADDAEIRRIALALRDRWRVAWIAPAHCTGEPAFAIIREVFADRYIYAGLGTTLAAGQT
jgi:7,8-dihydropterin-6-yl-methyl-4-(beta-D-ribofuranosyl)aminobenzene 5'-phosphate synthase